jgi:hypothetical protein
MVFGEDALERNIDGARQAEHVEFAGIPDIDQLDGGILLNNFIGNFVGADKLGSGPDFSQHLLGGKLVWAGGILGDHRDDEGEGQEDKGEEVEGLHNEIFLNSEIAK